MRLEIVEMRHTGHGGVYRAPAKSVAFWQQRGWEIRDETHAPQAAASAPATPPAPEAADTTPAARRTTKKEA